jgi:hypothetical protein
MSDLEKFLYWNLKSLSQLAMEVSAGKLERVVGGSPGVPPAGEGRVRVITLLPSDMDVAYCGGRIGKDG